MTGQRHSEVAMTLIEVLIVLAILGILLAIAIPNLRPPALRVAADAAQAFVLQGRFEAIRRNTPVAVTVSEGTLVTRAGSCTGQVSGRLPLQEYPQVSLSGSDLLWTASGDPRTCAGGALGLGGPRFTLGDCRNQVTLSVSGGGAVRIE